MAIFDGKKQGGEPLDGYLGRAAEVEGTLRFPDLLRVDGTVRGKVFTAKELVVGKEGLVAGEPADGANCQKLIEDRAHALVVEKVEPFFRPDARRCAIGFTDGHDHWTLMLP